MFHRSYYLTFSLFKGNVIFCSPLDRPKFSDISFFFGLMILSKFLSAFWPGIIFLYFVGRFFRLLFFTRVNLVHGFLISIHAKTFC